MVLLDNRNNSLCNSVHGYRHWKGNHCKTQFINQSSVLHPAQQWPVSFLIPPSPEEQASQNTKENQGPPGLFLHSALHFNPTPVFNSWYIWLELASMPQLVSVWGGSKGVINFPWIFYAMRSFVPAGHFRNISGHLFTWLVCGSFQWRHGLFFTDCIVWNDKDKVICFERSHWIHIGWWSTRSPKLNCFNYHSIYTSPTVAWHLLQLTFHEIWH